MVTKQQPLRIFLADLIHTKTLGDNQISGGEADTVVPLNVASIAAFIDQRLGSHVVISLFKDPEQLLAAVADSPPDVVGLSCYLWNSRLNDAIGIEIRRACPEVLIVMGGPSIREGRDGIREFLATREYLDVYVMYEGEWAFLALVEAVGERGRRQLLGGDAIANCAWLSEGALVYGDPQHNRDVDKLPWPYLTGWLDPFLAAGHIPLFETNRGCPFSCTFCVWGVSALDHLRQYRLEKVFAELDYVAGRFPGLASWIVADANFGILKRDVDIARRIRDLQGRTPALKVILLWESKNTSARNVEIARILGAGHGLGSGQDNQLIAVQTLDPDALEAVQRTNIKFGSMADRIRDLHAAGSQVGTHVLACLPRETFEGQLATFESAST